MLTIKQIERGFESETQIGFADLADIDRENPGKLNDEKIRMLGPFPFSQDKFCDDYLEGILNDAKEPVGGFPFRSK